MDDRLGKEVRYPILNVAGVTTVRLIKRTVRLDLNPYDPENKEYFVERKKELALAYMSSHKVHLKLLKKQGGTCPICSGIIDHEDKLEIDHITPLSLGGAHNIKNLRLIHWECHRHKVHKTKS